MKFAVIVFPGSNCDHDAHYALTEVLGQQVSLVWHKEQDLGCLLYTSDAADE